MGVNLVATYTQYLGILLFELAVELPERSSLRRSTRGKVEHVEGQHHVLLSLILAEANVPFTH